MNLEGLLEGLGGFGRYQIILTITLGYSKIVVVPTMLMMTFAGVEPDWWCTSHDTNLSQWNRSHLSGSYQNCSWDGTCDRTFSDAMVTAVSQVGQNHYPLVVVNKGLKGGTCELRL